jgi:hypothetical protein
VKRTLIFGALLSSLALGALAQPAPKPQLTDQQVAEIIVRESRQSYYRTGHPCACPEDLARNGSRCGKRSAYSRPGALPLNPLGHGPVPWLSRP